PPMRPAATPPRAPTLPAPAAGLVARDGIARPLPLRGSGFGHKGSSVGICEGEARPPAGRRQPVLGHHSFDFDPGQVRGAREYPVSPLELEDQAGVIADRVIELRLVDQ